MAETQQELDLIFALDIGTRGITGVLGKVVGERFKVLAIESEEHSKRAMIDGQIEDIGQVARLARTVTDRLEQKQGCTLSRVCVAAAGRALRTERASFQITLPSVRQIDEELISRLEAGAVSEAEAHLSDLQADGRRFYLVGYTVTKYELDRYPLTTLRMHNGQELACEVVATFLPSEVVESLYTAMHEAGLEVSSLTLEPIAALNAAIPAELRLLNLVLADIGAGTSDIAVCREGSVVGYTMATVAGDEITEALMRTYLVDFKTAERMKIALGEDEEITFTDILGLSQTLTPAELLTEVAETAGLLAREIAGRVLEVNGGAPSALFLAGGGSKLQGLRKLMAQALDMDERRVAIAGNNFEITAFSDEYDLNNPEYATPLGIAVSAALGLVNDSYIVMLNGEKAKLFRSGTLTVLDILMMNGFTYADLIGRTGQNMTLTVDGERIVLRGEPGAPASMQLNGAETTPTAVVHAGDSLSFTPATQGLSAETTVGALLGERYTAETQVNGAPADPEMVLHTGDVVETDPPRRASHGTVATAAAMTQTSLRTTTAASPASGQTSLSTAAAPSATGQAPLSTAAAPSATAAPAVSSPGTRARGAIDRAAQSAPTADELQNLPESLRSIPLRIFLNDAPLTLPPKHGAEPYYLMDLLTHSGLDFDHLEHPVTLLVNGAPAMFTQVICPGDAVMIKYDTALQDF